MHARTDEHTIQCKIKYSPIKNRYEYTVFWNPRKNRRTPCACVPPYLDEPTLLVVEIISLFQQRGCKSNIYALSQDRQPPRVTSMILTACRVDILAIEWAWNKCRIMMTGLGLFHYIRSHQTMGNHDTPCVTPWGYPLSSPQGIAWPTPYISYGKGYPVGYPVGTKVFPRGYAMGNLME